MSSKNVKKGYRRWTQEEADIFAEILSDPDNGFAESLQKLALKKSSNNEVFIYIQQEFINALRLDLFKEINEKKFQDKNGIVLKYTELGIDIDKLRVKYKALKQEWSRIRDSIKNGSGLSFDTEPRWFKHLNPVFCEANETIILSSSAADTSFVNERNESHDESEGSSCSESENPSEYSEDETQIDREGERRCCHRPQNKQICLPQISYLPEQ